jgi:hypothetical protein
LKIFLKILETRRGVGQLVGLAELLEVPSPIIVVLMFSNLQLTILGNLRETLLLGIYVQPCKKRSDGILPVTASLMKATGNLEKCISLRREREPHIDASNT